MKRVNPGIFITTTLILCAAPAHTSWGKRSGQKTAAKTAQGKLAAALRVEIIPGILNAVQESDDPCLTIFKPYKAKDMTPEAALANPFKIDWTKATNVQLQADENEKDPWWRNWIQVSVPTGYVPIHVAKSQTTSTLEAANELKAVCGIR